jgi:CelD/BcsL family acetyltransferase involved in cellulose biosynthesis
MTVLTAKVKTVAVSIPPGSGSIQLLMGSAAFNLIEDRRFLEAWNHLSNICPWTTVFQTPSFVGSWYRIYSNKFLPIIIKAEYEGKLTSLLTLAQDKNGLITGAGANLAEYQAWLTADANDDTFITRALLEINRLFPGKKIMLKYIPADASLGWIKNDPVWSKRCFVKTCQQPLMVINGCHLTKELKKKNRREKLNRLKRLGELKFERISDYASFVSVFDELALQYDFRKGSMYNKLPFKTDPLRKKFLLTLFEQNNLHATVLKLNEKIIASNVSVQGQHQVHLQGINSFAAPFGRYSPGILHFLLLGKLLEEEGMPVFDLTPGGDAYKETLATDHTVAYTLSIGNNYHCFTIRFKSRLKSYLTTTASIIGIKPDIIKKAGRNIRHYKAKCMNVTRQNFNSLLPLFFHKLKWRRKCRICWAVQNAFTFPKPGLLNIHKDNVQDLLNFDQREIRYGRQEFLADAMHRFEQGEHCYSWVENEVLLGCAWLTTNRSSIADSSCFYENAGQIFYLSRFYYHLQVRKNFSVFLQSVAAELAVDHQPDTFYIVADCDDYRLFEKAGFQRVKVMK